MSYDFNARVGDHKVPISGTLYEPGGVLALNLTTCTQLLMRWKLLGATAAKFTATLDMTDPRTSGRWSYELQNTEINAAGVYAVEFEATFSGGRVQTVDRRKGTDEQILAIVHEALG